MKKLLAIVLTAAMLLAMLCACAAKPTETAATDTKATIGILMPTKEQTIWSIQGERLTEAFQKAGYATQIEYAEDDSAKQAPSRWRSSPARRTTPTPSPSIRAQ